jgi:hypothetical protein
LTAWRDRFGDAPTTAAEAIKAGDPTLNEAFENAINSPRGLNSKTLGKLLKAYEGRIVDGLKIVGQDYRKTKQWAAVQI